MDLITKFLYTMNERASTKLSFDNLATLSKSHNGFKREIAIDLMDKLNDPKVLPLLIDRLNDWVPTVKLRAEKAFYSLMTTENSIRFVTSLVAIVHLNKRRRHNHNRLIETVVRFLTLENNKEKLIDAISSSNQELAFIAFRLCVDHNLVSNLSLVQLALQSKNLAAIK